MKQKKVKSKQTLSAHHPDSVRSQDYLSDYITLPLGDGDASGWSYLKHHNTKSRKESIYDLNKL